MKSIRLFGYLLSMIGITTMTGYSQETASEYVSPSATAPKGKAPSSPWWKSGFMRERS